MKLNLHLTNKLVTPEEEDEQRYPWAYNKKTKWNDRMKKRAIIWLSQRVGKPVLKLTALDYEKNNLRELLDEYGKAEFANLFPIPTTMSYRWEEPSVVWCSRATTYTSAMRLRATLP